MSEKVLMKGNEAIGEAAIRSGCRHFFGYPITPQTELSAYMAKKMPKIGGFLKLCSIRAPLPANIVKKPQKRYMYIMTLKIFENFPAIQRR